LAALALVISFGDAATADETDIVTDTDAYVNAGPTVQDTNFGERDKVQIRGGGAPRHSFIYFDLSGIPDTITAAELHLHLQQDEVQAKDIDIWRVTESWTEGDGSECSGVTWNSRDGVNAWTTPGGTFDATSIGTLSLPENATVDWYTASVDAAVVEGWRNGSIDNFGLALSWDAGDVDITFFDSSDNPSDLFPFLHVTHGSAAVAGDTDGDGDVDLDDLFAVRNNFGTMSGATLADGDTDGDGDVDLDDLFTVRNNFGTGLSAVPEPATLAVMMLGLGAILRRRAR